MRLGGGLTAILLGSFLGAYWFRGRKRLLTVPAERAAGS